MIGLGATRAAKSKYARNQMKKKQKKKKKKENGGKRVALKPFAGARFPSTVIAAN